MNRAAAVAAAVTCAACGNYSTEDLAFYAALPQREDLRVEVPSGGTPGALTAGVCEKANVWLEAKTTSDGLNRGVDFVLGLVDVVRRHPPSWRGEDERRWGPFEDDKHPGREIQIVIGRAYPDGASGPPVYHYQFQARVKGSGSLFTTLIEGYFRGASASRGSGTVALFFGQFWTLGMHDTSTPRGTAQIAYDRASDPVTVELDLAGDGFGVVSFRYQYVSYADGQGSLKYRFVDSSGNVLEVSAAYDAASAGRSRVFFTAADGILTGYFNQCWDSSACLVYVDDPLNLTCDESTMPGLTCSDISRAVDCVPVLAPPFIP